MPEAELQKERIRGAIGAVVNKEWLQRHRALILFAALHILATVIFIFGFNIGGPGDTTRYFGYSSRIVQGDIPYRDFGVEYPPLSLVTFILPRLLSADLSLYSQLFTMEMLLLDVIGLVLIAALARRWALSPWWALGIYTVALALLAPLVTKRYDLLPALLTLFALYAFLRGWHKASWAALALGTMAKLYPILLAPFFIALYLHRREHQRLLQGGLVFALTLLLFAIPWLVLSPSSFLSSLFTFHAARPLQIESTYASFLLLGQALGLTSLTTEFSYGAWNVSSSAADLLAGISPVLTLLSLALIYWAYARGLSRKTAASQVSNPGAAPVDPAALVNYSVLVLLVFIVTSKVLSAQFLIWLCPLIPFVLGRWRLPFWLLFTLICTLTLFVYPLYGNELLQGATWMVAILLLRNLFLIILAYLLVKGGTQRGVLIPP